MSKPEVGVVMGSANDRKVMNVTIQRLKEFGVDCESKVVSAHRTPDVLWKYAQSAQERGLRCIIAGAGGSAHLPGMLASLTTVPVLGVPILSNPLSGMDSLLSIVQMPAGVPVATFAIGKAGADNAALFAVAMLSQDKPALARRLARFRKLQSTAVKKSNVTERKKRRVKKRIKYTRAELAKIKKAKSVDDLKDVLKDHTLKSVQSTAYRHFKKHIGVGRRRKKPGRKPGKK